MLAAVRAGYTAGAWLLHGRRCVAAVDTMVAARCISRRRSLRSMQSSTSTSVRNSTSGDDSDSLDLAHPDNLSFAADAAARGDAVSASDAGRAVDLMRAALADAGSAGDEQPVRATYPLSGEHKLRC